MKHAALLLGCLLVIASSATQGMSQFNTRTGTRVPQLAPAPLKITTPAINGKSWIGKPLVQVENVSKKPIEYLTIQTIVPGITEPFMLAFGRLPGKPVANGIKALQPGEKINLSADQNACELMQKHLREMDARSLSGNHVTASINGVIFNDQTAWFNGLPHVMEPNNPLQWNVVRNTSKATDPTDLPMFSFLKVGLLENSNAEPDNLVCWDVTGTGYVDCCGIWQASAIMVKGSGIYEPLRHETECCTWREAVECIE